MLKVNICQTLDELDKKVFNHAEKLNIGSIGSIKVYLDVTGFIKAKKQGTEDYFASELARSIQTRWNLKDRKRSIIYVTTQVYKRENAILFEVQKVTKPGCEKIGIPF